MSHLVAPDKALPMSENKITTGQQMGPDSRLIAASSELEDTDDALPAKSSVVGVKRPRQKISGQSALEYVRFMTCMHTCSCSQFIMGSACQVHVTTWVQTCRQEHAYASQNQAHRCNLPKPPTSCLSVNEANAFGVLYRCIFCSSASLLSIALPTLLMTESMWHVEDDDEPR